MLLKFFKSNLPYVVLFIPILGTILWLPSLFPELSFKQVGTQGTSSPLFQWLTTYLQYDYHLSVISALIIIILQSYLLIRLNFKYIFIENKTYLPAVLFVLFSSSIFIEQGLNATLLANLFVLFAFDRAFLITKERRLFQRYFESGLFLGLAGLVYPPSLYFILIVWLTQVILRSFNWREWLSTVIGVFVPLLFYFSIAYLKNNFEVSINSYLQLFVVSNSKTIALSTINKVALGLIAFLILFALLSSLRIIGTKKVNSRKYFILFLWMLLLSIVIYFFTVTGGVDIIYFMAIPLSMIFSIFFIEIRSKFFAELLFTLLFLSIFTIIWF